MISAQIDELRDYASRADWTSPLLASALRNAASTIWELRDKLQRANTENAKLIVKLNAEHIVRQNVEVENDRLRELVKYAHECAIHSDHATCDDCERINGCCILVDRMCELGVEVDG